ncbi:hypothetical protein KsCSTR_04630 [Candidatus Kuenenia stuttgartiensis]|uniref:Uncharacterized protein n=1 Tax=Kuenenia stuttgartiensis TaxID=174633 RepID=Q1Q0C0_KUEST|nr:hypothetical protein KsCSTR_04630 [Candidatus Kuenenia stuttgartiensis]CAJ72779.1 unknown protein [Candidatus Kuenenia stuttgartiensis]
MGICAINQAFNQRALFHWHQSSDVCALVFGRLTSFDSRSYDYDPRHRLYFIASGQRTPYFGDSSFYREI